MRNEDEFTRSSLEFYHQDNLTLSIKITAGIDRPRVGGGGDGRRFAALTLKPWGRGETHPPPLLLNLFNQFNNLKAIAGSPFLIFL